MALMIVGEWEVERCVWWNLESEGFITDCRVVLRVRVEITS